MLTLSERREIFSITAAKHSLTADELHATMNSDGGSVFRTDAADPDDLEAFDAALVKAKEQFRSAKATAKEKFQAAKADLKAKFQSPAAQKIARRDARSIYRSAKADARAEWKSANKLAKKVLNYTKADPKAHFQAGDPDAATKGLKKTDAKDDGGLGDLKNARKAKLLKQLKSSAPAAGEYESAREKFKTDSANAWKKTFETPRA